MKQQPVTNLIRKEGGKLEKLCKLYVFLHERGNVIRENLLPRLVIKLIHHPWGRLNLIILKLNRPRNEPLMVGGEGDGVMFVRRGGGPGPGAVIIAYPGHYQ